MISETAVDATEAHNNSVNEINGEVGRPHNRHSYLPGIAHPLCPAELIERKRKQAAAKDVESCGDDNNRSSRRCNQIIELPVLQLMPGIIIFPGSTVPLRLRNPDWVRYLQRQIDRVSSWNDYSTSVTASSSDCSRATTPFDFNRDAVALGVLPAKFDNLLGDDNMGGRIGTLALITHLSREEETNPIQQHQIVATALGILRFRIIAKIGDTRSNNIATRSAASSTGQTRRVSNGNNNRQDDLRRGFYGSWFARGSGDMADMVTYRVEVIDDVELFKPPCPSLLPRQTCLNATTATTNRFVTTYMERISPIPAFAWEKVWPWKLMNLIKGQIATIAAWEGLRSNNILPSSSTATANTAASSSSFQNDDPSSFSFWMASNLPFSKIEQIQLLESNCIVSRLRFILNYIKQENDRTLLCALCFKPISTVKHLFTVPGSEGTTGAYVNEHGCIHQTITVKDVFERNVVCLGEPETKDSWFPGYSWTIAHCSFCFNHLGWKFLPVAGESKTANTASRSVVDSSSDDADQGSRIIRRGYYTGIDEAVDDTETTEIDIERHGGVVVPQQAGNRLRYFWGLSGSSVVSDDHRPRIDNPTNSEGEDTNEEDTR